MKLLILPILAMLAAPVAAAEPAAQVFLLDGEGACHSGGGWSEHNGSSSFYGWSSCADDFDYARLETEAVSLSASAHHENASGYESGYHDSGPERQHAWSSHMSDAWGRTVAARVGDEEVQVGRGCASTWSVSDSYSTSETDTQTARSAAAAHRCEHAALGASAAGQDDRVALYDDCASSDAAWGRSSTYGNETQEHGADSSASRCEIGVKGAGAGAGFASGCAGSSFSGSASSWSEGRCESGVFARGPDDASAFVGHRSSSWSSCWEDGCDGFGSSAVGGEVVWEHNPVGPGASGLWLALP